MRTQEHMTELLCLLFILGVAWFVKLLWKARSPLHPVENASQKSHGFHQHLPHLSTWCLTSSEVSLGALEGKRRK